MAPSVATFAVQLDADLGSALQRIAKERGWTPETLIADCVAQHLEVAVRHRVLIERLEHVDQHLLALAEFIGEATADRGEIDLSTVCRYHRPEKP